MRLEQIKKLVERSPFKRLTITLKDGREIPVTHPENIVLWPHDIMVREGADLVAWFEPSVVVAVHRGSDRKKSPPADGKAK